MLFDFWVMFVVGVDWIGLGLFWVEGVWYFGEMCVDWFRFVDVDVVGLCY